MINPLKIATVGYLKQTSKKLLTIAVAGYLSFSGTKPPVPDYNPPISTNPYDYPMGSGGGYRGNNSDIYYSKVQTEKLKRLHIERIQQDDDEIIQFIKVFVECQS